MSTVTIPKHLTQHGDLVVIPLKEYEALLMFKKVREFTPTTSQKKALSRAERNFVKGNTLSYHEFANSLEFTH